MVCMNLERTYIALLRGINVGGHRKLPMVDLRALLEGLGYTEVRTYVQSGNAVFEAGSADDHGELIRNAIKERFGYDVPVVVLTAAEFTRIAEADPFEHRTEVDLSRRVIIFLDGTPSSENLPDDMPLGEGEAVAFVVGHVFLCCPLGYGQTKLDISWFERRLGVTATARNMKTVMALGRMLGS